VIRSGLLKGRRFLINPLHQSQRLFGLYEREIACAMRRFAGRARSAVDVGAADGWYTVYFASRPNIFQVFACEPDPRALQALQENLVLNADSIGASKVSIVPYRIGAKEEIGALTLDGLLTAAAEPILVKIDVDGLELDCLEGFAQSLARRDVMLVVETHSAALETHCVEFCCSFGFRPTVIRNAWYRVFVPELRPVGHNRWFIAEKPRQCPCGKRNTLL
jgi:FkbM family methyltransferase